MEQRQHLGQHAPERVHLLEAELAAARDGLGEGAAGHVLRDHAAGAFPLHECDHLDQVRVRKLRRRLELGREGAHQGGRVVARVEDHRPVELVPPGQRVDDRLHRPVEREERLELVATDVVRVGDSRPGERPRVVRGPRLGGDVRLVQRRRAEGAACRACRCPAAPGSRGGGGRPERSRGRTAASPSEGTTRARLVSTVVE